jgi:branched-chain amino acid transport system substrate-binding protein
MNSNRRKFVKVTGGLALGGLQLGLARGAFAAGEAGFPMACATPMSGVFAEIGKYSLIGAQAAALDVPKVLGKPTRIVSIDTEGNPGVAVRKTREAIQQSDVHYFSGALLSSEAIAVGKEVNRSGGVAFVGAGADEVTGSDCNLSTFRWSTTTYGAIEQSVRPLAKMLPKAKRWYTITPQYVFGDALLSNSKRVFKDMGIEHVGNSYHSLSEQEFSGYLTNAIAAKPDVLLILNYGAQSSATLRQAISFGMKEKMTILMAYSDGVTQFASLGSAAIENVYFGCQYWHEVDAPLNRHFVELCRKNFKITPPYNTALTYLSTKLTLDAINRAGSADPAVVIKALEGLSYDGLTGRESIRAFDHQGVKQYYLLKGKPASQVKDPNSMATVVSSGESTVPIAESVCKMHKA